MARAQLAPLVGEPQRQAAAVVGVLRPFDQARAHQRVDRPADRGRAATDVLATSFKVDGSLFAMADSNLRLRAVRTFGWSVGNPVMDHRGEPRGNGVRR